jgi:hypothetical protein
VLGPCIPQGQSRTSQGEAQDRRLDEAEALARDRRQTHGQARSWEALHATSSRLAGCGGAGWGADAVRSRSSAWAAAASGVRGASCGGGSGARRARSLTSTWRRWSARPRRKACRRTRRGPAWSPASPRRSWSAPGPAGGEKGLFSCAASPSLGRPHRRDDE